MRSKVSIACAVATLFLSVFVRAGAEQPPAAPPPAPVQQPAPAQPPPGRAGGPGRAGQAFPKTTRPLADPATIERGMALYGINCRLCHGPDLRGGDLGGINLLRSQLVLADQDAELIHPVVSQGRNNPGMPPMPPIPSLTLDDTKAIAAYIRSVLARSAGQGGPPPGPPIVLNIVVGDPAAGQKYFGANCATCHSPAGDLAGIASRYPAPMQLQNTWVSGVAAFGRGGGGGAPRTPKPVTAVVTTADGRRFEGPLQRIDDFIVVIAEPDGLPRTFRRIGGNPKVQIDDPLDGHKKLWVKLTDKDMHDVTAYLVTLK